MWIILKDGSLEITAQEADKNSDFLLGGRGPIRRLFPDFQNFAPCDVHFYEAAIIDRNRVADAIANEIRGVTYTSFEPNALDLDPKAGVLPLLATPLPPGQFALELDGPVGVDRYGRTVFLTIPGALGSVIVRMTAHRTRQLAEEIGKQLKIVK